MSAAAGIGTIRALGLADVPAGLRLGAQAGWNQTIADWRRLLDLQPGGCFGLEVAGQIVATVTTTVYPGKLAWVGMMLVDQQWRRHGFGRRLLQRALDWLAAAGADTVMLDATPLGRNLYVQLGFRDLFDLERWQGLAPGRPPADVAARPFQTRELDDGILELDTLAFGRDRLRVLRGCLSSPGAFAFVTGPAGKPSGLLLARPGAHHWHIGPLEAIDHLAAQSLFDAALARLAGQPALIDVPSPNAAARELAASRGLAVARTLTRMILGGDPPAVDVGLTYGIAAPEIG